MQGIAIGVTFLCDHLFQQDLTAPSPFSSYTHSKMLSEQFVAFISPDHALLRQSHLQSFFSHEAMQVSEL